MENKHQDDSDISPKAWVDAQLKHVLGNAVLDPSATGSNLQQLKLFNAQFTESEDITSAASGDTGAEESEKITKDDRRTAAQIARVICAKVQIPAAFQLLDRIKPIKPAESNALSEGATTEDGFNAVKSQVKGSLQNLLKELNNKAQQPNVVDTLCKKYFEEDPMLIIRLGEEANLACQNIVTREDERSLINFIALCAHVRSICQFPIDDHLDCSVGQKLGQIGHNFGCMKALAGKLVEELSIGGVPDDCGPVEIPGVKDDSTLEHYTLVKRLPYDAANWQREVETHGKDGAAVVQAQVHHVANRFAAHQDHNKKRNFTSLPAMLNKQLVAETQQAADVLVDLMGGWDERASAEEYDSSAGDSE